MPRASHRRCAASRGLSQDRYRGHAGDVISADGSPSGRYGWRSVAVHEAEARHPSGAEHAVGQRGHRGVPRRAHGDDRPSPWSMEHAFCARSLSSVTGGRIRWRPRAPAADSMRSGRLSGWSVPAAAREHAVVRGRRARRRAVGGVPRPSPARIRSILGVPFELRGEASAALNIYSTRLGDFSPEAIEHAARGRRSLHRAPAGCSSESQRGDRSGSARGAGSRAHRPGCRCGHGAEPHVSEAVRFRPPRTIETSSP